MWLSPSGATRIQSHIHPSMDTPLLSPVDPHPRLLLAERVTCTASSPSLNSLDQAEGRTPKELCSIWRCTVHAHQVLSVLLSHDHLEANPQPSCFLGPSLGPPPSADSSFFSEPQAPLFLTSLTVYHLSLSWFSLLGRRCDPHHCTPNLPLRLIIFFVQHALLCCHACVLFSRHCGAGGRGMGDKRGWGRRWEYVRSIHQRGP